MAVPEQCVHCYGDRTDRWTHAPFPHARVFNDATLPAFELFKNRGCEIGRELEEWLKAERGSLGSPAAELADKDGSYELQVALEGFDVNDVQVTVTPTKISVHAASSQEKSPRKRTCSGRSLP